MAVHKRGDIPVSEWLPFRMEEEVIGQMRKLVHVLETIKQRRRGCWGLEETYTGESSNS